MKAVRHDGLKMPVGGKLAAEEIAAIEKWIQLGAPWPIDKAGSSATASTGLYERIKKEHWAFQPVRDQQPEPMANASDRVDRFIFAALGSAGLKPAEPADRQTLIRRLSLVLTGLPPTPLEVDLFVRDESPGAYPRLVDRLLTLPFRGALGAPLMDVMRFARLQQRWNYEIKGAGFTGLPYPRVQSGCPL